MAAYLLACFLCLLCGFESVLCSSENEVHHDIVIAFNVSWTVFNDNIEMLLRRIENIEEKNSKLEEKDAILEEKNRLLEQDVKQQQHEITVLQEQVIVLEDCCTVGLFVAKESMHMGDVIATTDTGTSTTDPLLGTVTTDTAYGDHLSGSARSAGSRPSSAGQRIRRASFVDEVAFSATVTPHDLTNLGANQNIVFDNDLLNTGSAYNPQHGLFTAPVDGTYFFIVTISGIPPVDADFYACFFVNDSCIAKFITKRYEQSTQSVVVKLAAGAVVSVKTSCAGQGNLLGDRYSSFSGFLLY